MVGIFCAFKSSFLPFGHKCERAHWKSFQETQQVTLSVKHLELIFWVGPEMVRQESSFIILHKDNNWFTVVALNDPSFLADLQCPPCHKSSNIYQGVSFWISISQRLCNYDIFSWKSVMARYKPHYVLQKYHVMKLMDHSKNPNTN